MHPEEEEVSETDEARVRRYAEAMDPDAFDDGKPKSTRTVAVLQWSVRRKIATDHARAVIAVADEEQAAWRAKYDSAQERLAETWRIRAEAAEAEVERLTRECLDREATETDARERLRQAEERLAAIDAYAYWNGWRQGIDP